MAGAPRQLNLSDHEQKAVLHALSFTTHPSAFKQIAGATEAALRQQAHPNFIRWSICNGNPPRITCAQALGAGFVLIGLVVAIVLTLSGVGRGYRALAAVAWTVGFATSMAAYKGMVRAEEYRHRPAREVGSVRLADFAIVCRTSRLPSSAYSSVGALHVGP
jgi:hypothetical protein